MLMHKTEADHALEFAEKVWEVWNVPSVDLKKVCETLESFRSKLAITPANYSAADNRYAELLTAAVKARWAAEASVTEPTDEEIEAFIVPKAKNRVKSMLKILPEGKDAARFRRTAFEICTAILKFTAAQQLYRYADTDRYAWSDDEEKSSSGRKKMKVDAKKMQEIVNQALKCKSERLFTYDVYDNQISGVYKYARTFNSSRDEILCLKTDPAAVLKVPLSVVDGLLALRSPKKRRLDEVEIGAMAALIVLIYGVNQDRIPNPVERWTEAFPLPFGGKGAVGVYLRETNAARAVNNVMNAYVACGGKDVVLVESTLGITSVALSQSLVETLRQTDGCMEVQEKKPRAVAEAVREYVEEVRKAEKEVVLAVKMWKSQQPDEAVQRALKELLNAQIEAKKAAPSKKKTLPSGVFPESSRDWLLQMVCAVDWHEKTEKPADWTAVDSERLEACLDKLLNGWSDWQKKLYPAVFNCNSRIGVCCENNRIVYSIQKGDAPVLTLSEQLKAWSEKDLWQEGDESKVQELEEEFAKQTAELEKGEVASKPVKYPFAKSGDSARTWLIQMICACEWRDQKAKGWQTLPENAFDLQIGKLRNEKDREALKNDVFAGKKYKVGLKIEERDKKKVVRYCFSLNKT